MTLRSPLAMTNNLKLTSVAIQRHCKVQLGSTFVSLGLWQPNGVAMYELTQGQQRFSETIA